MAKFTKQKQHKNSLCRCTRENPESGSDGLENNISYSELPGVQKTYNSKVLALEYVLRTPGVSRGQQNGAAPCKCRYITFKKPSCTDDGANIG